MHSAQDSSSSCGFIVLDISNSIVEFEVDRLPSPVEGPVALRWRMSAIVRPTIQSVLHTLRNRTAVIPFVNLASPTACERGMPPWSPSCTIQIQPRHLFTGRKDEADSCGAAQAVAANRGARGLDSRCPARRRA